MQIRSDGTGTQFDSFDGSNRKSSTSGFTPIARSTMSRQNPSSPYSK